MTDTTDTQPERPTLRAALVRLTPMVDAHRAACVTATTAAERLGDALRELYLAVIQRSQP